LIIIDRLTPKEEHKALVGILALNVVVKRNKDWEQHVIDPFLTQPFGQALAREPTLPKLVDMEEVVSESKVIFEASFVWRTHVVVH
jgi:hypothetical protein